MIIVGTFDLLVGHKVQDQRAVDTHQPEWEQDRLVITQWLLQKKKTKQILTDLFCQYYKYFIKILTSSGKCRRSRRCRRLPRCFTTWNTSITTLIFCSEIIFIATAPTVIKQSTLIFQGVEIPSFNVIITLSGNCG